MHYNLTLRRVNEKLQEYVLPRYVYIVYECNKKFTISGARFKKFIKKKDNRGSFH